MSYEIRKTDLPNWPMLLALFIVCLLIAGFLTQTVKLIDARTEAEALKIAAATALIAPEPDRRYDTRLEEYKWDPKTKTYRRIK